MLKEEIKVGESYTGARWRGDRRVQRIAPEKTGGSRELVVHFVDLRTSRTGKATLDAFANGATGKGLVSNI